MVGAIREPGGPFPGHGGPPGELAGETGRILACVHCGFCLDACPTYTRLQDEADSPRGRIYLIRAVAEGRLAPDAAAFRTHLDRCLGCRACEPVCPSGVAYGHLLERARAVLAQEVGIPLRDRVLLSVFGSPWRNRIAGYAGRLLRVGGLAAQLARLLPRRFHKLRSALQMLDATRPARLPLAEPPGRPGPTKGPPGAGTGTGGTPEPRAGVSGGRPRAAVLEGCVQKTLFYRVNRATDRVLRANGCEVVRVAGQGCCGALHAHAGDLAGARRLARANLEAFEGADASVVVTNAAGCGAFMKGYGELFADGPLAGRAAAFAARVRDVGEYLLELGPRAGAVLRVRVAYDAPCHLIHGQGLGRAPVDMLAVVPGLEVVPVRGAEECCGGAGTWGLAHPELAGRILEDKVREVLAVGAEALVTPNPGCAMQIGAGLRAAGSALPVLHPVELLDESYRRQGSG